MMPNDLYKLYVYPGTFPAYTLQTGVHATTKTYEYNLFYKAYTYPVME